MACVIKRGKVWYVKYRDVQGKQKLEKAYTDKARSVALANSRQNEVTGIRNGDIDPQQEQRKAERVRPVADHIRDYRIALEARGSSDNHVAYTVADIEKCFAHAGVCYANTLTRTHVDRWVVSLTNDTPRTVNRRVGSVQAFLRHLQAAGAVTEYVLHKYPKRKTQGTDKRKRRALTADECARLTTSKRVPEDRRFVYRFALLTGLRFAEIASMTPTSFNFTQGTITVRANDAKNKNRDQVVPMSPKLVDGLKKLCKGSDEAIFALPERTQAARLLRKDCEAAGIDTDRIDFHGLRHSYITRLAEAKVHPKVLQELARHSSIDTTLRYYTHFRREDERNAIGLLE